MSALNSSVVSAAATDGVRLFQWRIVSGIRVFVLNIQVSLCKEFACQLSQDNKSDN